MEKIFINIGTLIHFDENSTNPIVENGYLIVKNGVIDSYGKMEELELISENYEIIDVDNKLITPGFIDCHTHLIFAGNRADEFQRRALGESYESILQNGGGIHHTVSATRAATFGELLKLAQIRMKKSLRYGVTTCEIKSGYGLDEESELKILEVAKILKKHLKQRVERTYLGAHVVPKEFKENRNKYIDLICNKMIPFIKENDLAESVDVFIEPTAFSIDEAETIIKTAQNYQLKTKLHTEQLTHTGGTQLGVKYNSLSVDHLEEITRDDIELLSKSNTVAVLLPIATLFANKNNFIDAREMLTSGVRVAISTDFNPGSAHSQNIPLLLSLAVLKNRLTPLEALKGITLNAAYALGLNKELGSLEKGKKADILIHNISDYKMIPYSMGDSTIEQVFIDGEKICLK
ncbi:imidazolonepropionase [bacterium]|nr:imidazolonepropionase [bacterium]